MIPNNGYYEVLIHKDLKKCIDKRKAPFNNDYILKAFQKKVEYLRTDCSHPSLNFKPYTVSEAIKRRKGVDDIYEFYVKLFLIFLFLAIFYFILIMLKIRL